MSRYKDADALIEGIANKFYDEASTAEAFDMVNKVCDYITNAPSIDIVKCKECKHRTYCYGDVLWTNKRQTVGIHKTVDFCSFGEREGE